LGEFQKAVETFIKAADWLTDVDEPMITALREAAAELDSNGVQAALLNTYGVTYRTLLKGKQSDGSSEDDDYLDGLV
jgi:hypothetical protein